MEILKDRDREKTDSRNLLPRGYALRIYISKAVECRVKFSMVSRVVAPSAQFRDIRLESRGKFAV